MASYLDNCRFVPVAGGLGDWVVSAAVQGYMDDIQADAEHGEEYNFRAQSRDMLQWEISKGLYDSGTRTFARTTVLYSSNAGAKVDFTEVPEVGIVLLKADLPRGYTGDTPPTFPAPDDSFYIQRSNQDFWLRENGQWVRKGNIRDEGSGGIVTVSPELAMGFLQNVSVQRIRYLEAALMDVGITMEALVSRIRSIAQQQDYGYAMEVELSRVRYLAQQHDMGFLMDVVLTVSPDIQFIAAAMDMGMTMEVALSRTQGLSASMALGYSQANTVTHESPEQKFLVITDTASPWMRVFDENLSKFSDPATTPGGITVQIACRPEEFAIARNNGTFFVYSVTSSGVSLVAGPISTAASNIRAMKYSPDGSKLLVVFANGTPWCEVYETSGWTKVTAPAPGQAAQGGDWSEDGTEIALSLIASPFMKLYDASDMSLKSNPSSVMTHQSLQANYNGSANSHLCMSEGGVNPHQFWIYKRSDLSRVSTGTQPAGLIASQRPQWSVDGSLFYWVENTAPRLNVYERSGDTFTAQTIDTNLSTNGYCAFIESNNTTMHVLEAGTTSMIWRRYTWSGSQWERQSDPGNQPTGTTILGVVNGTL